MSLAARAKVTQAPAVPGTLISISLDLSDMHIALVLDADEFKAAEQRLLGM